MWKFNFAENTPILNFLNSKGITILRIIKNTLDHENYAKKILEELEKYEIKLEKSQLYRYIECLRKNSLITVEKKWIKSSKYSGYPLRIMNEGENVLNSLLKLKMRQL